MPGTLENSAIFPTRSARCYTKPLISMAAYGSAINLSVSLIILFGRPAMLQRAYTSWNARSKVESQYIQSCVLERVIAGSGLRVLGNAQRKCGGKVEQNVRRAAPC
jgi:hypothetical protein